MLFRQGDERGILVYMQIDILYVAGVIAIILVSMTFHELAHGLIAHRLGDDTAKLLGRLSLNPLRHVDPFMTILLPVALALAGLPIFGGAKPVPVTTTRLKYGEWGMALVAIAGPLTNLLFAFIAYLCYAWILPVSWVYMVVMVNLGFFVFNMLPLPPLDGSRVLYAVAPEAVRRGMEWIESYGIVLVFIVVLLLNQLLGVFMLRSMVVLLELFRSFVAIF